MADKTGYYISYDFEYKGHHDDSWMHELTFEELMKAVRKYFDIRSVTLDGTDTAVWNALIDIDENFADNIVDEMEDWLTETCRTSAKEEFEDWVDWYYDDEEEPEE